MKLSQKILRFNKNLSFKDNLPNRVELLNPFIGENSKHIWPIHEQFYGKYYADEQPRKLILGINPGRLGAGSTGLPFTDTKRLNEFCKIHFDLFKTHEPSSVFVYEMINEFGGPTSFYSQFYIGSVCPLGFVTPSKKGMVNLNYYDLAELEKAMTPFIVTSIIQQLDFGLDRDKIFVLGTGKNFKYLNRINKEHNFADEIIPLEHPRYVMQYKSKSKDAYIEKYLQALSSKYQ